MYIKNFQFFFKYFRLYVVYIENMKIKLGIFLYLL